MASSLSRSQCVNYKNSITWQWLSSVRLLRLPGHDDRDWGTKNWSAQQSTVSEWQDRHASLRHRLVSSSWGDILVPATENKSVLIKIKQIFFSKLLSIMYSFHLLKNAQQMGLTRLLPALVSRFSLKNSSSPISPHNSSWPFSGTRWSVST